VPSFISYLQCECVHLVQWDTAPRMPSDDSEFTHLLLWLIRLLMPSSNHFTSKAAGKIQICPGLAVAERAFHCAAWLRGIGAHLWYPQHLYYTPFSHRVSKNLQRGVHKALTDICQLQLYPQVRLITPKTAEGSFNEGICCFTFHRQATAVACRHWFRATKRWTTRKPIHRGTKSSNFMRKKWRVHTCRTSLCL
jgi:hypothetical protein